MTRKPLPKAITRPLNNLRGFGPGVTAEGEIPARESSAPFDKVEAEPALAVSSAPIANDLAAPAPELDRKLAARRRALARKIVDRHKNYAALGGLVPLPVANIASVTAINLRMVKQLSELYEVPFQRDRTRSLIVGLIGGVVPTGVGSRDLFGADVDRSGRPAIGPRRLGAHRRRAYPRHRPRFHREFRERRDGLGLSALKLREEISQRSELRRGTPRS